MSLWTSPIGEDRLLLWVRRRRIELELQQQVARILVEVGGDLPNPLAKLPGDARALRGIPVVGVQGGLGGSIAGTRPGDGLE